MKLGKKNQSFSSTRLNQLSSRSHSIFSIRIMRIEDVGTPRVHSVSELCLCDLAGSERCAKTQNKGERLKEAGNINTSLLILGKCISALRHNQQAKLLQHVPFRESKLTHYLQSFFCGRGKACMIVNINQCASMYDETLNVLKFSAVAQKVVVPVARTVPIIAHKSAGDGGAPVGSRRRSSLNGWESSLEDVQENDDDDEYEEESSLMEQTEHHSNEDEDEEIVVRKRTYQWQAAMLKQLQVQLKRQRAENMLLEARVREEIGKEFSDLFSDMQSDFTERLARERQILQEQAEERLEILKNLMKTNSSSSPDAPADTDCGPASADLAGMNKAVQEGRTGREPGRVKPAEGGGASEETSHGQEELLKALKEEQRGHQEALAALEKEKRDREDALTALEYQTVGKEEALASLKEERKGKEETSTALAELKRAKEELLLSFQEERKAKEAAVLELKGERQSREEALAVLEEEKRGKREAQCALEEERQEFNRQVEERTKKLQEDARADQASVKLQSAQEQLDRCSKEIQQKTSQMDSLTRELQALKQELQLSEASHDTVEDQMKKEVSELRKNLDDERKNVEFKSKLILELESKVAQAKEQSAEDQLSSGQKLQQLTEKLDQQEQASKQEAEELRRKLQEQRPEELESGQELQHLRKTLKEQSGTSEKQVEELTEKLRIQEVTWRQQVDELKDQLSQQSTSVQLRRKLRDQEQTTELLKAELEETKGVNSAAEDLKKLNADLEAELTALRAKMAIMEKERGSAEAQESVTSLSSQAAPNTVAPPPADGASETERSLQQKDKRTQAKLAELDRASSEREAALRKKLAEKEAEARSLQKSLREAERRREEEESQAVQEARRREVERRRELLAVAEEAITQKDAELEKRVQEISRLKESSKQDSDRVRSLNLDLQRKEDDTSDLREKLADCKKQIQQVQKEISTMREEERCLKQKLGDVEKVRRQLQCDVANRDRTIQQLKAEPSSDTKSDQTLQLYQKACADLEAKERLMADMRLALGEQEETQEQMEEALEEKLELVEKLTNEVEILKGRLRDEDHGNDTSHHTDGQSGDLNLAKLEAAKAQESLKLCTEKHQAERKRWLEEKLYLIGQAKEAEDKRNQEMRKFAEDRERRAQQHNQLESLSSQLAEKEQTMETWRRERDTLVSALEVQLKKLLSSNAEKDQRLLQLQQSGTQPPPPESGVTVANLQAALSERDGQIRGLKEELKASADRCRETGAQDEVEAENKRNTKTRLGAKLTPHQEESSSLARRYESQSSIRSKKEATLQRIGDFLQSSPTLLGSKAKKMMSLVSGRSESDSVSSSSLNMREKKSKRKLYRPEISSPMEMPSHPIINMEAEEKESDHLIIKRRLRSRMK
ncbi:uncharacterized protein LOC143015440 isoform X2 [Genypterus blacodes]|uniref:uncharacterized protein LOC143015440 isoform X2 n=1 Tax=Genypterus blacodes TaxID=154954 RepID=UPI003F76FDF1